MSSDPENRKCLYLLDAMALAYRSHYVFINRPLVNSKGQNTSATYGFVAALLKLIEDHGMDHVAVVFDVIGEGGTFRDEIYEDYKAHRDPPPEDLVANIPVIKRVVNAMDIPVVEMAGVEADDVIGTLGRRAESEGADVVIVSPDKDFQQLLSDRISMFRPAYRGEEFDPITSDSFREKFGLEPEQFVDVLALMGDASDNVPGVPGIGEKTAVKLVQEYETLETLLMHVADVKGKRAREGLEQHGDDAVMSKKLVRIKTDLDLDLDWKTLRRHDVDLTSIRHLFSELEFGTLLGRVTALLGARSDRASEEKPVEPGQQSLFGKPESPDSPRMYQVEAGDDAERYSAEESNYSVIRTAGELSNLVGRLQGLDVISLDTETTSKDSMWASLVGLSFSSAAGEGAFVPTPLPDGTPTERVLESLEPVLSNQALKVGQNIKYDLVVLAQHGVAVKGDLFDTMIAHYLLAPEESHALDALALRYLGYRPIPITDLLGTGRDQISMRDVALDRIGPYACEDADVAMRLRERFGPAMEESGVSGIAEDMEFPLVRVLADMERRGIRVDADVLREISRQMEVDLSRLRDQVYDVAGGEFNIGSPAQLGEILFEKLKLPVVARTSTGKPSTRERVLQELATEHELPRLILDWRELSKLRSTYVDTLPGLVHPETGRVHTSFNQTVAATGRLSSSNPNLQNIPVRSERGREIRKAFVAEPGFLLMSADYVQIELRILASMSEDEELTEAFRRGDDIHTATAARVFKVRPGDVTREQRSRAKEVNYGIPYGISAFGLAQRLRCPVSEAQDLIDQYLKSYPRVTRFLRLLIEKARESGYAQTLLGRRRYVPSIHARNRVERSAAERIAVNMPIQGTQADMIKIAMIRIHSRLAEERLGSRMLLQVHDELVLEVVQDEMEHVREIVDREMSQALPLSVPVEVDVNTAENWLDAH